jgi:hypothetical protein
VVVSLFSSPTPPTTAPSLPVSFRISMMVFYYASE